VHFNLDAKSEGLPAPKSDELSQMGIQAAEGGYHLHTTNLQITKPGWSRRNAGDALMERTYREERLEKANTDKSEVHRICMRDRQDSYRLGDHALEKHRKSLPTRIPSGETS
jgi:hypothetical protein